jgi:hypothetical protein
LIVTLFTFLVLSKEAKIKSPTMNLINVVY